MSADLLQRLLSATYRFRDDRRSLVVLQDLSVEEADQMLDGVVASAGVEVAGIEYLSDLSLRVLVDAGRRSELAVIASADLRRRLADALSEQTRVLDVASGLEFLEERRTPVADPPEPSAPA